MICTLVICFVHKLKYDSLATMDQVDGLRFSYAEYIKFLICVLWNIFRKKILLNLDLKRQLVIFGLIKRS